MDRPRAPSGRNPAGAFSANGLAAGSAGLGLFMGFWSWVGFESTAMYGEESRGPKRIIPRAPLVAVAGIGLFFQLIPYIVLGTAVLGAGLARCRRFRAPDRYEIIGRVVPEDTVERGWAGGRRDAGAPTRETLHAWVT
ncbi:hypothetical protein ACSNOI_28050 [Actinomadura kijaniata]|uniref:hypothetical protein n=1 Tax=Actinomadura kijaniata TaxID=46161 RepID=UPI003F1A3670